MYSVCVVCVYVGVWCVCVCGCGCVFVCVCVCVGGVCVCVRVWVVCVYNVVFDSRMGIDTSLQQKLTMTIPHSHTLHMTL